MSIGQWTDNPSAFDKHVEFAFAQTDNSTLATEPEGGTGQVAIHGMANLTGTLGTASSHGCVRLSERSIRWLAARIGPGVRVAIAP